MMQALAYCSYYYYVSSLHVGSLYPWDLVEGSLYHVSSPVAVYTCDAQCCQGWGICKGIHVQLC